MFNLITNISYCVDQVNAAPLNIVRYSHIPTAIIALLLGIFILYKTKGSLQGKLLFLITASFSVWAGLDLLLWEMGYNSIVVMSAWSMLGLASASLFILCFYFTWVFIKGTDLPFYLKAIISVIFAPVAFFAPTVFNLFNFDVYSCAATEGFYYTNYYYLIGLSAFVAILLLFIFSIKSAKKDGILEKIILVTIGIESFLFLFFFVGFIASYLVDAGFIADYTLEPYGLFGMPIFIGFLAYLIVKFKAFNIKLIGAQALVYTLIILIGSQFFFIQNRINMVLTGITLLLTITFGGYLIRGVKREIDLSQRLKNVNSILSHDVKGSLGKTSGIYSMMVEGTFGPIPDKLKEMVGLEFIAVKKLITSITTILQSGSEIRLELKPFDFKSAVLEVINAVKPEAEKKGLVVKTNIDEKADYTINADQIQLSTHVLHNLIENAVNYTPTGFVEIGLSKKDNSAILLSVKDSGVGITSEDKEKLFKEAGHGAESTKVNVHSTGYGLFIAKKIVDAHGGKIWFESEGVPGKGSTFFVELPIKK